MSQQNGAGEDAKPPEARTETGPIRLLIAPMGVAAETGGPFGRARALALAARDRGHLVAFCAAEDPNYRPVAGVPNYRAPLPSPFGTPLPVGRVLFRVALTLFRDHEMPVTSFEQALHIVGATTGRFFERDVRHLRVAIRAFRADAVFAVERPAAIVAARLERVRAFTSYSLPMGSAFASNPEYSKDVNRFLVANHLPLVRSVLDVFDWADRKIVPSAPELEPLSDDRVVYIGPFQGFDGSSAASAPYAQRRRIVAYTGSGGISAKRLIRTLSDAFASSRYEVYVASKEVRPFTTGGMHVDRWFDFDELLPEAVVYVHHGGQNSVVSGLLHGVPQVICAGRHYERRYNGSSVEQLRAGVSVDAEDLTPERLRALVRRLRDDPSYAQRARDAGEKLLSLGGVPRILDILETDVPKRPGGAGPAALSPRRRPW